jgi:hypothetical protein
VSGRGNVPQADTALVDAVGAAILQVFSLRRTVQKNLAVLTVALLRVLGAARGGYGCLSLATIYRVLPTPGTPHAREKRLRRFLANPRLDPRGVTNGLARFVFGRRGRGLWPIVFDQTKAGSTQALVAGVPYAGRVLPLSVYTFQYPWEERAVQSQNRLEEIFLTDVQTALPQGVQGVFIGDRGYARAALLSQSRYDERLYVIRGRGGTGVEYNGRKGRLRDLPCGNGRPVRYEGVYYQAKERVPVDVIAYHDPSFQEPWWLLVPAGSRNVLPTRTVVALYRERMQVEHCFRDFKTHLGLRGLKLRVHVAERTGRLLLGFMVAYCLALALGGSPEALQARAAFEIRRRRPRHGTRRTLSVLSVAMQMLSHPQWQERANYRLRCITIRLADQRGLVPRSPPRLGEPIKIAA